MRTIKTYSKRAPFYNALIRWDEKAGLQRDAYTLPRIDVLEAQKRRPAMPEKISTMQGHSSNEILEGAKKAPNDRRGL